MGDGSLTIPIMQLIMNMICGNNWESNHFSESRLYKSKCISRRKMEIIMGIKKLKKYCFISFSIELQVKQQTSH